MNDSKLTKEMQKSNFQMFKLGIHRIGGVFAGEDVYFSQMKDVYSAAYKPDYPNDSIKDISITQVFTGVKSHIEASLIPGLPPKRFDDFEGLNHYIFNDSYELDCLCKYHDDMLTEQDSGLDERES